MGHQFKVGQRVVCVDDAQALCMHVGLVKGQIYEVLAITACSCGDELVDVGHGRPITVCRCCHAYMEGHWKAAIRFRPLDTLEADLHRIESEGCPVEQEEPVLT